MGEFPLPIGQPTWHGNLSERKIEDLFGFIEALVSCPPLFTTLPLCRFVEQSL